MLTLFIYRSTCLTCRCQTPKCGSNSKTRPYSQCLWSQSMPSPPRTSRRHKTQSKELTFSCQCSSWFWGSLRSFWSSFWISCYFRHKIAMCKTLSSKYLTFFLIAAQRNCLEKETICNCMRPCLTHHQRTAYKAFFRFWKCKSTKDFYLMSRQIHKNKLSFSTSLQESQRSFSLNLANQPTSISVAEFWNSLLFRYLWITHQVGYIPSCYLFF